MLMIARLCRIGCSPCAAHCSHVQIPYLPRLASIPLGLTSHLSRSIHGLGFGFAKLVQWSASLTACGLGHEVIR